MQVCHTFPSSKKGWLCETSRVEIEVNIQLQWAVRPRPITNPIIYGQNVYVHFIVEKHRNRRRTRKKEGLGLRVMSPMRGALS